MSRLKILPQQKMTIRWSLQENLIQGKVRLALKNWNNLFGDQREDWLTSLEVCYSL